ncbi:MAG TPA: class I SAM-dependent methyltransferase [Bryobacteraceae bacterium]|jgi:2-polyprenyl-3-methyl-5-hydroxy-6-metoxy-1,4-benzoquinol methylase|nr:class I SAM-dependent methyltransferase [Bryobacteraceae bacterium]
MENDDRALHPESTTCLDAVNVEADGSGETRKLAYGAVNKILLPLIPRDSHRFLDVGCGTGALAAAIHRERDVSNYEGITYSEEEAALGREKMNRVWSGDLNRFSFDSLGQFDCVICSHVLEHLYHPEYILRQLRHHLAPDGVLLVALPNVVEIKTRLAFLRGRFRYTESGILDRTHFRFFDRHTSRELVRGAGFAIDAYTAGGHCPLPVIRKLLSDAAIERLDTAATTLLPGLLATQFVIRGRIPSSTRS